MPRPKKVLIIDDDHDTQFLIEKTLKSGERYTSLACNTASDGLEMAKTWHPDIIILDMNLPKMTGLGCLRELKNNPKTKPIPVVVFSGTQDLEVISEAMELGAQSFLSKDDDRSELLQLVQSASRNQLSLNTLNSN